MSFMDFFSKNSTGVVKYDDITKEQNAAVEKLYRDLVKTDLGRRIDIKSIVLNAFPLFKECLGETTYTKLMKYIGFTGKKPMKNAMSYGEYALALSKMRTVENAQQYIYGFSSMVETFAKKLYGAPEGMSDITKAKLVRMYNMVFCGYYYFVEDYRQFINEKGDAHVVIDYSNIESVNKKEISPEEMYYMHDAKITYYEDGSMLYDTIVYELGLLDKKMRNDILDIGELKMDDELGFVSVNKASNLSTFGAVRKLKLKLFPIPFMAPIEVFFIKTLYEEMTYADFYICYKLLKDTPLDDFNVGEEMLNVIEGSRVVKKPIKTYEFAKDLKVTCKEEAQRYVHLFEYTASQNFVIQLGLLEDDGTPFGDNMCHLGIYYAAMKLSEHLGYITPETDYTRDLEIIQNFVLDDKGGVFEKLRKYELTFDEAADLLGVNKTYEEEILGFEHIEDPVDVVVDFAKNNGYIESDTEEVRTLISEVFIPGAEDTIQSYYKGELDDDDFMKKIGFDEDFAEMYFDLAKVEIDEIEEVLQGLKKKLASQKEMLKYALLIKLYCYVIEEHIPCGPKGKVPKGNKSLKPKNLKAAIAA